MRIVSAHRNTRFWSFFASDLLNDCFSLMQATDVPATSSYHSENTSYFYSLGEKTYPKGTRPNESYDWSIYTYTRRTDSPHRVVVASHQQYVPATSLTRSEVMILTGLMLNNMRLTPSVLHDTYPVRTFLHVATHVDFWPAFRVPAPATVRFYVLTR